MKKKIIDPFLEILPNLDLHGVDRMYAIYKTNEFIEENIKLKNKKILIIHGRGTGIIRKTVHETLKKNKKVEEYYLDNINIGATIVVIKKEYLLKK